MSREEHVTARRCGGANDGRTPNLGCTQEPRRKAAYCIDAVVSVGEKKREKVGKSRIVEKSRIDGKGRIGGGIHAAGALLYWVEHS